MNASQDSRLRLWCRVVRGWSLVAGDPATGAVARHGASCPACREYFAASHALEARLRAAAPRQAQALPHGFEQRLERALAPLTRPAAPPENESGSRWVLWSFFGTLTAAAALAFVLLRPADLPPSESGANRTIAVNQAPATSVPALSPDAGGALLELAQENPLQREIDNVYADARGALRFLALNFLPEAAIEETPSS